MTEHTHYHSESAEAIRSNRLERQQLYASEAIDLVNEARGAYQQFQAAWQGVGVKVRNLNEWQYHRVDAYPGWNGTRDVGAGKAMEQWMDEVEESLYDIAQSEADERAREQSVHLWQPGAIADGTGGWVLPSESDER